MLLENVMMDIISRLPVKTIMCCKCVCKKWQDLVSDPYFVRLHLSRSPVALMIHRRPFQIVLNKRPGTLEWEEVDDYHRLRSVKIFDLERCLTNGLNLMRQVGSVNGLIACWHDGGSVYIFNPLLEQYIVIPEPQTRSLTQYSGFGVSTAGEYKVIKIGSIIPSETNVQNVIVGVYTLGTNKWRETRYHLNSTKNLDRGGLAYTPGGTGVLLNNHVYFLLYGEIYDFDLIMETFELLFPSPPAPLGVSNSKQLLGILKGRLSCVSSCSSGLEIWVMKEETWYKEIAISPFLELEAWSPLCLIDSLKGTSILFVYDYGTGQFLGYCLDTNTILPQSLWCHYDNMMAFRPSFVTLNNFGSNQVHVMQYKKQTGDEKGSRKART